MNTRVKELRKTLGLTLKSFGEKVGMSISGISDVEKGRNNVSNQLLLAICREFNVNEEWLRTGEGDMFITLDAISLDELASDIEPIELDILKAYFSLDKDIRKKAIEHFCNHLK